MFAAWNRIAKDDFGGDGAASEDFRNADGVVQDDFVCDLRVEVEVVRQMVRPDFSFCTRRARGC